jgi:hypothetical protein
MGLQSVSRIERGVQMAGREKSSITFEYRLSPNFTVYAVSGAFGGLNTQGEIVMTLYNERSAIPDRQTYNLSKDGSIDKRPVSVEKKEALVREVMLGVSMNPAVARSVGQWLIEKAEAFEKYQETQEWEELDLEPTDDH